MAEVFKIIARSVVHLKVTDGSGTPLTYTFKLLGPPTFSSNTPKESEAVMGQQGGASVIEAIAYNGVSGPGDLDFVIPFNDPGNSTDATAEQWVSQMENDTFSGGLSTFTSTNGLPYVGKSCAIWQLTFENVGTTNADHSFAADGYVESTGQKTIVNGALGTPVKVKIVEGWTRAAS